MDRKTLLAVVISVVVIVGGMLLQSVLFPPKPAPTPSAQQSAPREPDTSTQQPAVTQSSQGTAQPTPATQSGAATASTATTVAVPGTVVALPESAPPASQGDTVVRDTDLYSLSFSSAGATLSSVKLKKHQEMVFKQNQTSSETTLAKL